MTLDATGLTIAFLAGMALGAVYMAALWVSVTGLRQARRPAMALLGGMALRIAALMGLFYLVMDGRWERLLACLAGFLVVRVLVTRRARPGPDGSAAGG